MPTVEQFENSLLSPSATLISAIGTHSFSLLSQNDGQRVVCNSSFAEAIISAGNSRFLLLMPLSDQVRRSIMLSLRHTSLLYTPHLSSCHYLSEAMHYTNYAGDTLKWDLVMEQLPEGVTLREALEQGYSPSAIIDELHKLQGLFHQSKFIHGMLSLDSIILRNNGSLTAFRLYKSHYGDDFSQEDQTFNTLIEEIAQHGKMHPTSSPLAIDSYEPMERLGSGLVRFCHEGRYGYKDPNGKVVIKAKFLWATPFFEQRAVIRTKSGMGVISTTGKYILEPMFQDIHYNTKYSQFHVRLGDEWAIRGYNGERVTEYSAQYAPTTSRNVGNPSGSSSHLPK